MSAQELTPKASQGLAPAAPRGVPRAQRVADHHRPVGVAKDAGAAAVLLAQPLTGTVWLIVFRSRG